MEILLRLNSSFNLKETTSRYLPPYHSGFWQLVDSVILYTYGKSCINTRPRKYITKNRIFMQSTNISPPLIDWNHDRRGVDWSVCGSVASGNLLTIIYLVMCVFSWGFVEKSMWSRYLNRLSRHQTETNPYQIHLMSFTLIIPTKSSSVQTLIFSFSFAFM